MRLDPFVHYLGINPNSDPAELLGLRPEHRRNPVRIEQALRRRLATVYQHPDHYRVDLDIVVRSLREAAEKLKADIRHLGPVAEMSAWQLTDFDRSVMAVLVGYGGWNAASRSRLIALCMSQGVPMSGLMKVIQGLGEYAKSGGPTLAVSEISPRFAHLATAAEVKRDSEDDSFIAQLPQRTREFTTSTVKLSIVFGVITLLVGLISLFSVLSADPASQPSDDLPSIEADQAVQGDAATAGSAPSPRADLAQPLQFDGRPSFRGERTPEVAVQARDAVRRELDEVKAVQSRLLLTDDPAISVYQSWDVAIDAFASGWMLLDDSDRELVAREVINTLFAARVPSVSDRLLSSLQITSQRITEPIEIWRNVWFAGMLGRISAHGNLPPVITEPAGLYLRNSLLARPRDGVWSEITAADAWLNLALKQLVDLLDFDPHVYDHWELWLIAQRNLPDAERSNAAMMQAVRAILEHQADVAGNNRAVNVLGRLLSTADFQTSPAVRREMQSLFESHDTISNDDLWVVTSLLANGLVPWFSSSLVLRPDEDETERSRAANQILRRWPAFEQRDEPGHIHMSDEAIVTLLEAFAFVHSEPVATRSDELMNQLVNAARFNAAAALFAANQDEDASRVLRDMEGWLGSVDLGPSAGARRSTPANDGEWAAAYEQARRDTEERLSLLVRLRRASATDLGLRDAEVLVREVYRGMPVEVRSAAHAALMERYAHGPHVAMEMLDQFVDAGRNQMVADLLQEYTGVVLPQTTHADWRHEARRALVMHALRTLDEHQRVDTLVEPLTRVYMQQASAIAGRTITRAAVTPADAAEALLDACRNVVPNVVADDRITETAESLSQRHMIRMQLAEGPIHEFVAGQLSVLDLLSHIAATEQPQMQRPLNDLLAAAAQQRAQVTHVLAQAVLVERMISQIWMLRMGIDMNDSIEEDNQ